MTRTFTTTRSLLCSLAATAALAFIGSQNAAAQALIYGIGNTAANPTSAPYTLFSFNSNAPGTTTSVGVVTATSGYVVTSIAFQPTTGQLFGFQYNATSQQGQLVTINRFSAGAVTPVGSPTTIGPIGGGAGDSATISFNPGSGGVRLVLGNAGNYTINATSGVITQATGSAASVTYPASGDANSGRTYQIATLAYTNSPTLYDIDYINNSLATQNLTTGVLTTVGPLGITLQQGAPSVGFTIGLSNTAFLNSSVSTQGSATQDGFYSLNLGTGTASFVGLIGASGFNTADIAAFVPEPGTYALFALGGVALLTVWSRRRVAAV